MNIDKVTEVLEEQFGLYETSSGYVHCVFREHPAVYGPCAGWVYEEDSMQSPFQDIFIPVWVCEAHQEVWNNEYNDTEDLVMELGLLEE